MDFTESPEHALLREAVAKLAADFGHAYYADRAKAGGRSTDDLGARHGPHRRAPPLRLPRQDAVRQPQRAPWAREVEGVTLVEARVVLEVRPVRRPTGTGRARDHQTRSASRCGCGFSSTLMPTIASPRPRETLAMTSGSS